MIKIVLGNVGSGKTALMVREMFLNQNNRKTYSNIMTSMKSQVDISPEMIISKEIIDYKKNKKTGEQEPIYKCKLNIDYWKGIKEPINIILDEAHSIVNARRSMTTINIIVNDWLALIRRVLGQAESGYGELIFVTQLAKRIDIIVRDMCTCVIYTRCHYLKVCKKCDAVWQEHSDEPESRHECPRCGSWNLKKQNHNVEVWNFKNMKSYEAWTNAAQKTYYKHYIVTDIEKYFKYYNTLQWDNLFSAYY